MGWTIALASSEVSTAMERARGIEEEGYCGL